VPLNRCEPSIESVPQLSKLRQEDRRAPALLYLLINQNVAVRLSGGVVPVAVSHIVLPSGLTILVPVSTHLPSFGGTATNNVRFKLRICDGVKVGATRERL
jgi:hypothetical protein